ncbi:MAG: ribonuclease P protein component [Candidatus Eremiobacteraeota bacterium]|nr:ribonuclease P protein component [Candidatus Eremiobacteraeota bacterium]
MRWYTSLRRSAAFTRVRQQGRRLELPLLRLFLLERRAGPLRVGIAVPGSVGGAVTRNRVRRRILGALDCVPLNVRSALGAADLIFIARPQAGLSPYSALAADVVGGLVRVSGGGSA